jgi:hypothetical protein
MGFWGLYDISSPAYPEADTMLSKMDDYPIHQTSEPVAHPGSSDRNVYDRYWFNGYQYDGAI